jgi:hypothetical protein
MKLDNLILKESDRKVHNNFRIGLEVGLIIMMIGILLTIHGSFPIINAPTLSVQSVLIGEAKCIAENGLTHVICEQFGYPVGYNLLVMGYPATVFMAILYKYLSIPLVDGIQLINLLYITLGFLSLYLVLKQKTSSVVAASVASFGFYSSAFIIKMNVFSTLYLAFLLFPFYIFVSLFLFDHALKNHQKNMFLNPLACGISQVLLLSHSIMLSAYSYVMTILVLFTFLVGLIFHPDNKGRRRKYLIVAAIWAVLMILPGLLYKLLIFTNTSMYASSLDFIRGESIDIATIFVPTQRYMLSNILRLGPLSWNSFAFYGDGLNSNYNYLGILAMISALIGIFLVFSKSHQNKLFGTISLVILVVGYVFSIGPSLKVFDVRSERQPTQIKYNDYLMPAEEATISLPSAFLFNLPVISTMRATYRWQLIIRFAMAFFIATFLSRLIRYKPFIAILISLLILLENIPASAFTYQNQYRSNRQQGILFSSGVEQKLAPLIKYNDRVLFLPAANDYLLGLIIPFTGGESYNVFFDKELTRILPLLPEPIIAARARYNDSSLTSKDVCELFNQNLVDVVVFNDYSMRWDSYSWPPTTETIEGYRLKVEGLNLETISDLDIVKSDFFEVVTSRHIHPLECK